ncbi:MAG: C-terminal binding protein [SAR202 cluster bacterium]|nr:C-terminal binding protein [SAR202 cluster bacterium]
MEKFKIVTPKSSAEKSNAINDNFKIELESFSKLNQEIVIAPDNSEDEFISMAKDADAIFGNGKFSAKIINSLNKCQIIALGSVGTDTMDVKAATHKGIPVTNIPDTFIDEVAEHTLCLILAAYRRIFKLDKMAKSNEWSKGRDFLYEFPRLRGQTLGLISFGNVARSVAKRAAPFGLNIISFDPYVSETVMIDHGVSPVSLEELLTQSDIVSMHAPGGQQTEKMMTKTHFESMKNTALFVNNGRGSTVDEKYLIEAIEKNWIAGAALDVLEKEPPNPDNPLLKLENVILTPHVASASSRFDPARRRRMGVEVSLVLSGKWPTGCVNPEVLQNSNLKPWQPYSSK